MTVEPGYIDFFGLKLSVFTKTELKEHLIHTIIEKGKMIVYGYSLGSIVYLKKFPEIYHLCNQSDIILCDGRILYLLNKFLGYKLGAEVSIPDFVNMVLKIADSNRYSVLLFGGTPENNRLATNNLKKNFPNILIKNGIDGYFSEDDEVNIKNRITELNPDFLMVGISTPKKENFLLKYKDELDARIIIPCGGMIDVLAGTVKLTPKIFKKLGLASIFRVSQEPYRLIRRYLFIYSYLFFVLLPVIFFYSFILKNRKFNIPHFLNIDN